MKTLVLVVAICLLSLGMAQAEEGKIAIKEGVSYSFLDSNWEQVTLAELYKIKSFSLNIGMRNVNQAILDVGYDLGKYVEPLKVFADANPILKPISPVLTLVNPSVDLYAGYKYPFNTNEFDYGINIVALTLRW